MTRRPQLDERDPAERAEWEPTSSAWARRAAIEATEAAIRAARDSRTKPADAQKESR